MTDFKSSRTVVRTSTIAGGKSADTHRFSGSVFLHDATTGVAAAASNLQLDVDNQIVLTAAGGGGGGAPGAPADSVQVNDGAGGFAGDADLTWDGTTLRVSGTTLLSGTAASTSTLSLTGTGPYPTTTGDPAYFVLQADKDLDSAAMIGQAYMGYGGFLDRAVFGHKDSQAVPTSFAFMQKGIGGVDTKEKGSVSINAPIGGYLSFAISSAHKARFSVMNLAGVLANQLANPPAPGTNPQAGFAIGTNYFPSYALDVSGGMRIGTMTDKMQTNVGSGGKIIPSFHYITGTMQHWGAYTLHGPLPLQDNGASMGMQGRHSASVLNITASVPRGCVSMTVENTSSLIGGFDSKVLLYQVGALVHQFSGTTTAGPTGFGTPGAFFLDTSLENCANNVVRIINTSASADFVATNDSNIVFICNVTGGLSSNDKRLGVEPSGNLGSRFATVTGSDPGCFGAGPVECSASFTGGAIEGTALTTLGSVVVSGSTFISGALFVTSSGLCQTAIMASGSITASCAISASSFHGDGSQLKNLPGGGSPGAPSASIQFNDGAGNFAGDTNFKWEGGQQRLRLTGTLVHTGSYELSGGLTILASTFAGSSGIPLLVRDDEDASARIGRAHIGFDGTNPDATIFSHRDNANQTDFALLQTANGNTLLNAKTNSDIDFRQGGVPGPTEMTLRLDGGGIGYGLGIGTNYLPGADGMLVSLDVSGSTRFGGIPGTSAGCDVKHIFTGSLRQQSGSVKLEFKQIGLHTAELVDEQYTASLCDHYLVFGSVISDTPGYTPKIRLPLADALQGSPHSQGHTIIIKRVWAGGGNLEFYPSGSDIIDGDPAKDAANGDVLLDPGSVTLVSNGQSPGTWWIV